MTMRQATVTVTVTVVAASSAAESSGMAGGGAEIARWEIQWRIKAKGTKRLAQGVKNRLREKLNQFRVTSRYRFG